MVFGRRSIVSIVSRDSLREIGSRLGLHAAENDDETHEDFQVESKPERRRRSTVGRNIVPRDFELAAESLLRLLALFGVYPLKCFFRRRSSRLLNLYRHLVLLIAVLYTGRLMATSVGNTLMRRDLTYMMQYVSFGFISSALCVALYCFLRESSRVLQLIRDLNAFHDPLDWHEIRTLKMTSRLHICILVSWALISITNSALHWQEALSAVDNGHPHNSTDSSETESVETHVGAVHGGGLKDYFTEYLFGWSLWSSHPSWARALVIADEFAYHWIKVLNTLVKSFFLALAEFVLHKLNHLGNFVEALHRSVFVKRRKSDEIEAASDWSAEARHPSCIKLLDAFHTRFDEMSAILSQINWTFSPLVLVWYADLLSNAATSLRNLARDLSADRKLLVLIGAFELAENLLFIWLLTSKMGRINDFVGRHMRRLQIILAQCSSQLNELVDERELNAYLATDSSRLYTRSPSLTPLMSVGLGKPRYSSGSLASFTQPISARSGARDRRAEMLLIDVLVFKLMRPAARLKAGNLFEVRFSSLFIGMAILAALVVLLNQLAHPSSVTRPDKFHTHSEYFHHV